MTETKTTLCISVGEEETNPVSSRGRIALPELVTDKTDANTTTASAELD